MGAHTLVLLTALVSESAEDISDSDQGLGTSFICPFQEVPGGLDTGRALDPVSKVVSGSVKQVPCLTRLSSLAQPEHASGVPVRLSTVPRVV